MKSTLTSLLLLGAASALILDSRCAADSVREAMALCTKVLIPGLFPLFVVSSMAVPHLRSVRIPGLARLLRFPEGCEGLFVLGTAGGFPVGASCISQMVRSDSLSRQDAVRMLGLCSNCGPSFHFGVLASVLSMKEALWIFLFQLISSLILGILWPGQPGRFSSPETKSVDLHAAIRRSVSSMTGVCAWVILAAVLNGFLRRWIFPMLDGPLRIVLTGVLELTGGIIALDTLSSPLQLLLGTGIVCFGGISVLLQIRSCAWESGIPMRTCVLQKATQSILAMVLCMLYLRFGAAGILISLSAMVMWKIAVEISRGLVYNTRRKEGI